MRRKHPRRRCGWQRKRDFTVEKADVELEKDPESEQFASVRSVTVYVAGSEAGWKRDGSGGTGGESEFDD